MFGFGNRAQPLQDATVCASADPFGRPLHFIGEGASLAYRRLASGRVRLDTRFARV